MVPGNGPGQWSQPGCSEVVARFFDFAVDFVPASQLVEERPFLVGQRVVEAEVVQEFFGRADGHHFHDATLASQFDTLNDQQPSQPFALMLFADGQALDLSQLLRIDFDGREANDVPVAVVVLRFGNEPGGQQPRRFQPRPAEDFALFDEWSQQFTHPCQIILRR